MPGIRGSNLTVANLLTSMRIVLVPVFGHLWLHGAERAALYVFGAAILTDVLDGFLARHLDQRSSLGAVLDPVADKLLMVVSLVIGSALGVVPVWLTAIVIGRDALLGLGLLLFSTAWRGRRPAVLVRPTRIGKYAMFFQSVSIVGVILADLLSARPLRPHLEAVMVLAAVLTCIAGAQYVLRATSALRAPAR